MKRVRYSFVLLIVMSIFYTSLAYTEDQNIKFDFLFSLTQQDLKMDWWFYVPSQFGPHISTVKTVAKGEVFRILPIFNNYGTTSNNEINITYDLEILKPDGSLYESIQSVNGYKGKSTGPHLIPALDLICVSFDPEDPYGEYTINIKAYDNVKKQNQKKTKKIKLEKFSLPELEQNNNDWFLNYPTQPQPAKALAFLFNNSEPCIDEDGEPVWSGVWFLKIVIEENKYLIPHLITAFKEGTDKQKKDIILLLSLLKETDKLGELSKDLKELKNNLEGIKVPDPYTEISTASQLDMLWAEFFATSRVAPIRQIITSSKLRQFLGTLEKIKKGELDIGSEEVEQKVMLEAVLKSAIWSMISNCEQSPLIFQYFLTLYDSDELNKNEKHFLGTILNQVSKNKKEAKERESE